MNFTRCFISAELPDSVKEYLAALQAEFRRIPGASRVPGKNLHITLAFLGNVGAKQLEEIIIKTGEAIKGFNAFECSLEKLEAVPSRMPRLLWVSVKDEEHLTKIREALKAFLPLDNRRFGAHVTLARIKSPGAAREISRKVKDVNIRPTRFKMERISIMESRLAPGGAVYSAIKTIMLKSA